MITGTDRCCLLWDNTESFFPALAPFPWAVTARRSLIDSAIRICALLKFQPIENLQPLMGALMPGGTLHYYNHESKEEFSTMDFSLVGWEGGTFLRDTALNFWSSKSLDMEFKPPPAKQIGSIPMTISPSEAALRPGAQCGAGGFQGPGCRASASPGRGASDVARQGAAEVHRAQVLSRGDGSQDFIKMKKKEPGGGEGLSRMGKVGDLEFSFLFL